MKDKEKQIEETRIQRKLEMTKDISNGISGVLAYEIQKLAEHLISLNYVKPPEDSVVLSKGEKNALWLEAWDKATIQAIEETSKRYKAFIKELLTNGNDNLTIYYGDVKYRLIREDDLQELAKQFGVEIKE